jgi:prepilin-type N-terminal cleavage/methylation domain-containing protein
MKKKKAFSLIEIMVSLIILSTGIMIFIGVIGRGLMMIKKGENVSIASNFAISQLQVYKENFHKIPFYPGIPDTTNPSYYYPDRNNSDDLNQTGKFVHHNVKISDLPDGTYFGNIDSSADFYHRSTPEGTITTSPYYDLNKDGFPNDIIEPFPPMVIKNIKFIPVVEIKRWKNGFNINNIKHMIVTVYWKEKNTEGGEIKIKRISIEGFIARTKPDPW